MKLLDLLKPEFVRCCIDCRKKDNILDAIAEIAVSSENLKGVEKGSVLAGLKEREALSSTGIGGGVAIPHCRLDEARDFVIGILAIPAGVDFQAMDGKKVRLVVFVIAPASENGAHIRLLSQISHILKKESAVAELADAADPEDVLQIVSRYAHAKGDNVSVTEENLFHVLVNDKASFEAILEVFASFETTTIVVTDGQMAGAYLAKLPLFASFWSERESEASWIILATAEKRITNEIIRRIEDVAGDLSASRNVCVIVQPVFYRAGSIS
ncbi:MAG: PTS sugar transporter subunit IIA [Kiritimatiellia bacterium]